MPQTKKNTPPVTVDGDYRQGVQQPPAVLRRPLPAALVHQRQKHEQSPEVTECAPPDHQTGITRGRVPHSKDLQGGGRRREGGFSRSQGTKRRDYDAARKSGVGPGSSITSSSDRAVSECVNLKLTLKQRLDK